MKERQDVFSEGGSAVTEFYRGAHILVTGATGFVGKALVEKLLRSCPDIEHIYLFIRSKKGQTPEERCKDLLKSNVFDRIRSSGVLKKVEPVAGDVMEPELGLSETDKQTLIDNVTVVFHSAATVKFNETLQQAVRLNTMGTQSVLKLCKQMKKLQAVIHVSTAYSNAGRREIGEEVYPPPASPQGVIECARLLDSELVEQLGDTLVINNNHPNTYTITKAMAETIVAENSDVLPVGIVRPSIVTAAWREPFPGWVDNISGITGLMMEVGRGTIRSIICNEKYLIDIIPVDIVVDTLIVAAWHTAMCRGSSVPVYNCTSGRQNPLRWSEIRSLNLKHSRVSPSKYVQWYPGCSFTTNRPVHFIKDLALHTFPAFLLDILLQLKGSKPIMLKLCRRMKVSAKTGEFFALHEWDFACDNQMSLEKDMPREDRALFMTDISQVNWDDYIKQYMLGIRKYVLKDSQESLPAARSKLRKLWWFTRAGQLFMMFLVIKLFLFR